MMKIHPVVGFIILILVLLFVSFAFWHIIFTPPRTWPIVPNAALTRDENASDYTLTLISLTDPVDISDVELRITLQNDNALILDLEDILFSNQIDETYNITYHDLGDEGKFSPGDKLVLKIDYDGPNRDGNNDGNFINDGPISEGDVIRFIHKEIGGTMCVHTISF